MKPNHTHFVLNCGTSFCSSEANGWNVARVQYGELRNVYADQACNYSYREFWF